MVIKEFNGDLLVTIDDKVYELRKLQRNSSVYKEFDEVVQTKEKNPMTHPWKIGYFKKQVKKAHTSHVYA